MLAPRTQEHVEPLADQGLNGSVLLDRQHAQLPAHILAEIADDRFLAFTRFGLGAGRRGGRRIDGRGLGGDVALQSLEPAHALLPRVGVLARLRVVMPTCSHAHCHSAAASAAAFPCGSVSLATLPAPVE